MSNDADIIVVGGGLIGTATALSLSHGGLRVMLVEPERPQVFRDAAFDGRGYALALTSQRVLKVLGLWSAVAAHAQPILGIKVSDGRAGEGASPLALEFDHAEIEEGPMGFMIEDRFLRVALMDAVEADPNVEALSGVRFVSQDNANGSARVTLDDGRVLSAKLIIGADGQHSAVGKAAGIRRTGWGYGQTSLVCAIDHELAHDGVAHQFFMPPGPLAILPLPGNQSSIVWTETTERAAEIQALKDAEYLDVLRPGFGSFLGEIGLAGARFTYPLTLSIALKFAAHRVALVGDAAHRVHPIAGQGLNAGLKDVAALAEVLIDAKRRGEDIGRQDVVERYQRWRRFDSVSLAMAMDGINRLFSNDNSLLRAVRDLGLGAVNALPGLRRNFIREAAGLTGQVPKLLQGKSI